MAKLAKSKSGHDKEHVYIILKEDTEYVYLVDGIYKTLDKPKKKNKKHIQVINQIPEEVLEILGGEQDLTDLLIKRALKVYMKKI